MAETPPGSVPRVDSSEPLSMDKFSRNARLYGTFLRMGLFVEAHYTDDSLTRIDHFVVSAGFPDTRDQRQFHG